MKLPSWKALVNKRGPKKKKELTNEIVKYCDQCGKHLGRTCARTAGSAVCAGGVGVTARKFGTLDGVIWRFFCTAECADAYRHRTSE